MKELWVEDLLKEAKNDHALCRIISIPISGIKWMENNEDPIWVKDSAYILCS